MYKRVLATHRWRGREVTMRWTSIPSKGDRGLGGGGWVGNNTHWCFILQTVSNGLQLLAPSLEVLWLVCAISFTLALSKLKALACPSCIKRDKTLLVVRLTVPINFTRFNICSFVS